jgi:hypothetical protein
MEKPKRKDYDTLLEYLEAEKRYVTQNSRSDKTIIEMHKAKDFKNSYARVRAVLSDKNKATEVKVKAVTDFIKGYLSEGQLNSPSIKRLLTQIEKAAGSRTNDLGRIFNTVFHEVISNQIKNGHKIIEELLDIKATKLNAKGQREGKKIDNETRVAIGTLKENMQRSANDIKELIKDKNDIIEDKKASEDSKNEAKQQLVGLLMANAYSEKINNAIADIKALEAEMKQTGNEKVKQNLSEALNNMKTNLAINITTFNKELKSFIDGGKSRYKDAIEKKLEHKKELLHKANSATKGVKENIFEAKSSMLRDTADFIAAPLRSLNHILKRISIHAVDGKSELYHYASETWHKAAESEYNNIENRRKEFEVELGNLFGYGKKNAILKLLKLTHKSSNIIVNYEGEELDLTYGNALAIVLWNRQDIGAATLAEMGIDGHYIETQLKETAKGRALLKLGNWMTDVHLPEHWARHNEEYKKRHGTDLGKEDNYFPLKRLKSKLSTDKDIASDTENSKGVKGTASATRERTNNLRDLNIKADAIEIFLNYINEMEHETAFGQFKEDMNILINSRTFTNKLNTLHPDLAKYFEEAVKLAYSGRTRKGDEGKIVDILKNVNAAKIAFRTDTSLKQAISGIAVLTEADSKRIALELGKTLVNVGGSYKWAMKNLPLFRKRVSDANAGNEKVRFKESDRKSLMRRGMWLNRKMDAITVAVSARAVYNIQKETYLKMGYSENDADYRAKLDATRYFNETQQSAESFYLSPFQADATMLKAVITSFRNADIANQRKVMEAAREFSKNTQDMYESEYKRLIRDGLSEDTADKWAKERASKAKRRAAWQLWMYSYELKFIWNVFKNAGATTILRALWEGDDDRLYEILKHSSIDAVLSPVSGMAFGDAAQDIFSTIAKGEKQFHSFSESTLIQDVMDVIYAGKTLIERGEWEGFAANLARVLIEGKVGIDIKTVANWMLATEDLVRDGICDKEDLILFYKRLLAVRDTSLWNSIRMIRDDELPLTKDEMRDLSRKEEIAEVTKRLNKYINRVARAYRYKDRLVLGVGGREIDISDRETTHINDLDISKIMADYMQAYIERLEFREENKEILEKIEQAKKIEDKIRYTPISEWDDVEDFATLIY